MVIAEKDNLQRYTDPNGSQLIQTSVSQNVIKSPAWFFDGPI